MTRKGKRMSEPTTAATDHDAIVSEVMAESTPVNAAPESGPADETIQVKDRDGVVHTLREPSRCIVIDMRGRRVEFTVERGSRVETQGSVGRSIPEDAEDKITALGVAVAERTAGLAREHNIQVIRVFVFDDTTRVLSDTLRAVGFYVVDLPG